MSLNHLKMAKKVTPYFLIIPSLIVILLMLIYPLVRNVYLSFQTWNIISPSPIYKFIGFKNYLKLFNDNIFWSSLRITIYYVLLTVSIEFVGGFGLAHYLNLKMKWQTFWRNIAILPWLCPPAVMALIWRLLWDPDLGPFNAILRLFGLKGPAWIADPKMAFYSVAISESWKDLPFVALMLLSGLQSLPQEPYDAAKVDGASSWKIFYFITIPLLKPIILIVILFQIIFKLRSFDIIWIMTGGGPGGSTQTLSILIYKTLFRFFKGGESAALSVIMLFLTVLISIIFFKQIYKETDI